MLMKLLVPALLVLSTSFNMRAAPSGADQLNIIDTVDILRRDSLAVVTGTTDPKSRMREIPVNEFTSPGFELDEMHPVAISFTREYETVMGRKLASIGNKVQPQFILIESILEKFDLPTELKYLAVVESQLESRARSHMGAVGPWQFMPVTARTMGLKVTKYVDERRDLAKSTYAAAKYLKNLYKIYNDWLLVIAAYNGGPGNVNKAITRSGSRNFWELEKFLPAESRKHVKKYIATQYIMAGYCGLTALTKAETEKYHQQQVPKIDAIDADDDADIATLSRPISGRFHSSVISKHLEMDIQEFLALNPSFDRIMSLEGAFELKLPADKMEIFVTRKSEIISESLAMLLH